MDQKVKQVFMTFTHTKKVDIESFIKARIRIRNRIRSGPRRPDPDPPHWLQYIALYTVLYMASKSDFKSRVIDRK
jgi:hypothetical protein